MARDRVAATLTGMVALLIAVPAHAETGAASGTVPPDPIEQPGKQPLPPSGSGGGGLGASPAPAHTGRPILTVFDVSPATATPVAGGAVVRFQVRDRAKYVRVRLAFVSLADGTAHRVNLGSRRTGRPHTYSWSRDARPGAYRVRITARNPRGRRAVRSTTAQVAPAPGPAGAGAHPFPIAGIYSWGGSGSRFGAARNGHTHQGQDLPAAQGTPLVAVATGTIHWRAYQAAGAGHYLVLDADGENYNYVYMHLQSGSMLVDQGDRVAAGQRIANVGSTGGSEGPHLHFEIWAGPWFAGGHPVDPYPFLKSWE